MTDMTAIESPLARRWRGRWIWPTSPPITLDHEANPIIDHDAARGWACLRHSFRLRAVPESAPARLTADSRYVLWVNGHEVARGPIRGNPRRMHHDEVDLAPHLVAGDNCLAVLARFYGGATPWWMPANPTFGLGGGAFAFEARVGDGDDWIVSDGSWRAHLSDAWLESEQLRDGGTGGLTPCPPERFDARRLAADWNQPEFDDRSWTAAIELRTNHLGFDGDPHPPTHPYGPLVRRPIPQLSGDERTAAIAGAGATRPRDHNEVDDNPIDRVTADLADSNLQHLDAQPLPVQVELTDEFDAGLLVLDFGEQVSGLVSLELSAPEGTVIDAKAAEAVDERGALDALQQRSGFRYTARGAQDQFETFDPVGLRYLGLSLRGSGTVTIKSATVRERLAPRGGGPSFECSDPLLNQIWAVGRRTVDLCSHDAYLDCPSREQRAWTGDSVVHQLVDLTTNVDWDLPRWNLELAASPRADGMLPMAVGGDFEWADTTFIPDWALHWIHALFVMGRYSGDEDLIRRLLPVAERVLQWFLPFQADDGLLTDVTGWVLIDWSAVSNTGKSGALNALFGRALREFQKLSDQVGDGGRARWAGKLWVRLRRDFEQFWDEDRQLFVDCLPSGGRPADVSMIPVSQHTNAAAITARLTRGIDSSTLVDAICDPDRLVHASWLAPGQDARLGGSNDPGDMYGGFSYLALGAPEPWWDTHNAIVAAQPFFRYVVHDAAADAERADLIPRLCRDWERLLQRCPTSWSETWFGGSHCHGWSSTPTRDLVQYTLGITPSQPGFARATVAPALGDLDWARGSAPTPHGLISVDARPDALSIDTPVETVVVFDGIDTRVQPGHHDLVPR
jgi:alpha-L-rhamnosidase